MAIIETLVIVRIRVSENTLGAFQKVTSDQLKSKVNIWISIIIELNMFIDFNVSYLIES